MLTDLSHITIAVGDLDESFEFYVSLLGFKPHAKWNKGAYLTLGQLWLCLSVDDVKPSQDYSHIAFEILQEDFLSVKQRLMDFGVVVWKQNKSEGDSIYFLDPDGYKLEIHVGNLQTRLNKIKQKPYGGLKLFD